MSQQPDSLIREARADGPTLGVLLERYRKYLTLMAGVQIGKRLQGKVDAADLVQETFLDAHRGFARFEGTSEGQLVRWLQQILARRIADVCRRYLGAQGRDVRLEQEVAEAIDQSSMMLDRAFVAQQSSPSQQAARREQSVQVADALAELSDDYRTVIVLRHLEGLKFGEIAERMGRSIDSVEKLWVRALARLKQTCGAMP